MANIRYYEYEMRTPTRYCDSKGGYVYWPVSPARFSRSIRRTLIFAIAAVFTVASTAPVTALTPNQAGVLNQGIFYFDTELGCINNSASATALTGADNAQKIFDYFVKKGYSPDQAAGILGNTTAESGNVPTRLQDGVMAGIRTISYTQLPANVLANQQAGWGIVQWTPPTKVGTYAQTFHENPDDLSTQVEFLWKQLEGTAPNSSEKQAGDQLKAAKSYIDATMAFLTYYERPKDIQGTAPARIQLAKEALAAYNAAGGTASSDASGGVTCGNTGNTGTAAVCNTPVPNGYDAIKNALLSQFKINLTGIADVNWAAETYNTVCALSKAPTYYSKLIAQGPIGVALHSGGCGSGHASSDVGVDLYGFCNKDYNRYILAHELGHMYAFRNPAAYQSFLDTIWGKAPSLPTWDCQIHFGDGSIPPECWAAMIGEYLIWFNLRETVGGAPAGTPDFKQYPTQYSAYYNFAKNLFGGVVYNSF